MLIGDRIIWAALGFLALFVIASLVFLIVCIDHLEAWREKRAARDPRKGDRSRP
jgi:hypothetical protein